MPASFVGDETKTVSSSVGNTINATAKLSNGSSNRGSEEEAKDLSEACAHVHRRVYDFLERETQNERIRQAQRMTRESLDVIGEALRKYR